MTKPKCTFSECKQEVLARGLCKGHYSQRRRGVELSPLRDYIKTDDLNVRLRHYAPEGSPDECWEWTAARNKNYGMITVAGSKLRGAHIVAWEIANEQALPEGMLIRHTCDNPPCTNPSHLELGTQADNMDDKSQRGRWGNPRPKFRHRTPEEVKEIRRLAEMPARNLTAIARQFECSRATVIRIARGDVF